MRLIINSDATSVFIKTDSIGGILQARKLIFFLSQNGLYLPNKQPWVGGNIKF